MWSERKAGGRRADVGWWGSQRGRPSEGGEAPNSLAAWAKASSPDSSFERAARGRQMAVWGEGVRQEVQAGGFGRDPGNPQRGAGRRPREVWCNPETVGCPAPPLGGADPRSAKPPTHPEDPPGGEGAPVADGQGDTTASAALSSAETAFSARPCS